MNSNFEYVFTIQIIKMFFKKKRRKRVNEKQS